MPPEETIYKGNLAAPGSCALRIVTRTSNTNTLPSPADEDAFQPLLFKPRDERELFELTYSSQSVRS